MWSILTHLMSHFCSSLGAEEAADNSGNMSGNEDAVSLSDIIPETNICFVSLNDYLYIYYLTDHF